MEFQILNLKNMLLKEEQKLLNKGGIKFVQNFEVGKKIKLQELRKNMTQY